MFLMASSRVPRLIFKKGEDEDGFTKFHRGSGGLCFYPALHGVRERTRDIWPCAGAPELFFLQLDLR
jgi:hypothetical protein